LILEDVEPAKRAVQREEQMIQHRGNLTEIRESITTSVTVAAPALLYPIDPWKGYPE
jgi:hypothetical protein